MDISEYFSLEFLLVIASVIFILLLPKILITIAKKSKTGFIISLVIVGIIITSLVVFFTYTYNYKYSLNGICASFSILVCASTSFMFQIPP